MNNSPEVVVCLVKHSAAIDLHDSLGRTAFHFACASGNLSLAKWMTTHGSTAYKSTREGNSALHMACAIGDVAVVKWLVEAGLKIDVPNKKGLTPILYAHHNGHCDVVNFLVVHSKVARPTGPMRRQNMDLDIFR
jgi:ankyrin repeat protein